ncbi:MAG: MmcQ/YjbR family DNA-binding protein [Micromonosporaceae bacterium]|nr:MmcQ/YjbR family DNA-binding protein [Micromonosporaceae bacterium]
MTIIRLVGRTDPCHPVEVTRTDLVAQTRAICLALPEVTERLSHGTPTWFVRDKTAFVMLWPHGHHRNEFPHLWCAAPPGEQGALIAADPDRFFRPPYVGHRGWLGVRLDRDVDWTEIAELCIDAYRTVAPKRLVARLDGSPS